jgi:hypothetical protein
MGMRLSNSPDLVTENPENNGVLIGPLISASVLNGNTDRERLTRTSIKALGSTIGLVLIIRSNSVKI